MRALTIKQPWADLVMVGLKDVENRSWPVPSTLPEWWRCTCGALRHYRVPTAAPWCGCAGWEPDGPFPFRLWIHAGQQEADYNRADLRALLLFSDQERWRRGSAQMPGFDKRGVVLGSVLITGCHLADHCVTYRCEHAGIDADKRCIAPCGPARLCSRWAEPDAYHWTLTDPQPLPVQVPLRGRQGLWTLPDDVAVPT